MPRRRSINARFCPYWPNSMEASLLSSNASTVWVVAVSSETAAVGITEFVVRKGRSSSCRCKGRIPVLTFEAAEKAVAAHFIDDDALHRSDTIGRRHDLHRLQVGRAADELARKPARLFEQHVDGAPGKPGVEAALMPGNSGLQPLQARGFLFLRDLFGHFGGRRAQTRRVHEGERTREADLVDKRQSLAEIGFGFSGEADDEIGREGEVASRRAQARND